MDSDHHSAAHSCSPFFPVRLPLFFKITFTSDYVVPIVVSLYVHLFMSVSIHASVQLLHLPLVE